MLLRIILPFFIILLIEWYFFQAIKTVSIYREISVRKRKAINYISYGYCIFILLFFLTTVVFSYENLPRFMKIYFTSFVVTVGFSKLLAIPFLLVDDIIRLFRLIVRRITPNPSPKERGVNKISRSKFLNQTAIIVSAIPFSAFIYGMFKGAFDYTIKNVKLKISDLPDAFKGLKIVQISDLHLGSFVSDNPLKTAVELINSQNADIQVTFSGHTHGFQFGVEIPGIKWSPSQYFYKQWAGLYKEQNQYLYVNRGLGFIGYAGRVGILPEITIFELS